MRLQKAADTDAGHEPEASEPPNNTETDGSQDQNDMVPEQERDPRADMHPGPAGMPRRSRAAKRAAEERIYIDSLNIDTMD